VHDYSVDISDKVQRGRKQYCIAWSDAQPTSGSADERKPDRVGLPTWQILFMLLLG
jgi:hypothetical protein